MYRVIKYFTDMQDNNHPYKVGDEYPRKGVCVLPSRIKELMSKKNRQGEPLIEEVEEAPKKKAKSDEKADEE
jgi:hypothetical protein